MQLTANTLIDLVKSLRADCGNAAEKRLQPRVGLRARASILQPGQNVPIPVWVRDVSAGGLNILCSPLVPGEACTVMLGPDEGGAIPCTVRHCKKVGSELFAVGAQFHFGVEPCRRPGKAAGRDADRKVVFD